MLRWIYKDLERNKAGCGSRPIKLKTPPIGGVFAELEPNGLTLLGRCFRFFVLLYFTIRRDHPSRRLQMSL
jgi:hypothetical protein